jgi:hypothetical protein
MAAQQLLHLFPDVVADDLVGGLPLRDQAQADRGQGASVLPPPKTRVDTATLIIL